MGLCWSRLWFCAFFFLFFLPVLKPQVEAFLSCNIIQEVHDISQMLSVKFMKMAWEIIIKCLDYGFIYKKAWMTAPLCLIWTVWKERNRIAFDNEELSIQRMKNYFVCNFCSWTKLFIDEGLLSLINFVDWLGSKRGRVRFWFPLFFFALSFRCLLYTPCCILPVCFGLAFGHPFFSKKKKDDSLFFVESFYHGIVSWWLKP